MNTCRLPEIADRTAYITPNSDTENPQVQEITGTSKLHLNTVVPERGGVDQAAVECGGSWLLQAVTLRVTTLRSRPPESALHAVCPHAAPVDGGLRPARGSQTRRAATAHAPHGLRSSPRTRDWLALHPFLSP